MADVQGRFITLVSILMSPYPAARDKADAVLFKHTKKHWKDVNPDEWIPTTLYNLFMQEYAEASPQKEQAIVTLGRQIYPTIKKSPGLPNFASPLEAILFENDGYLGAHRGPEIRPRNWLLKEPGHVIVDAPAPGYNPILYVGVFQGILEMMGEKKGKVVMLKNQLKGAATSEFDISW